MPCYSDRIGKIILPLLCVSFLALSLQGAPAAGTNVDIHEAAPAKEIMTGILAGTKGLSDEQMRRLSDVVVKDWLYAPEHVANWLTDSSQPDGKFPSSVGMKQEKRIRALMASQKPDGSWPDVDYENKHRANWKAADHFDGHLEYLVLGYATPGSPLYHNPELKDKILLAIDYWLAHDYSNSNWWQYMIGLPAYRLGPVLLAMKPELSEKQRMEGAKILSRCDLKGKTNTWRTGGNCLFDCRAALFYSLFAGDSELAGRIFDRMLYQELRMGRSVKDDYSEWEHGNQIYNHGYGAILAEEAARFLWYASAAGIPTDPKAANFVVSYIMEGSQWMTYRNGYLDYGVAGRQHSRPAPAAPRPGSPPRGNYLTTALRYLEWAKAPRLAEIHDASDRLLDKKEPLEGNRFFYVSDYMVDRRRGYFASLHMSSTRMVNSEIANGENTLGHHLGEGSYFLIRRADEYNNIFPVWDWNRIPGTTANLAAISGLDRASLIGAESIPAGDLARESSPALIKLKIGRTGRSDFVGGVSDGQRGVACAEIKTLTLTARKAWFFFGNGFTCLGAGITDSAPAPVVTAVNQCRSVGAAQWADKSGLPHEIPLSATVANATEADSQPQTASGERLADCRMVFHDGIAYLFPDGQTVSCSNQPRRGSWQRISTGQSDAPIEMPVFSLWIEHGEKPANGTYAYHVLPDIDLAKATAELKTPSMRVLQNSPELQAVEEIKTGTLGAVFYSAGKLDLGNGRSLSASAPCVIQWSPLSRTLAVADPSQATGNISVQMDGQSASVNVSGGRTTLTKLSMEKR